MTSYQYRKSHCEDLTTVLSTMGFPALVRWHLYIEWGSWICFSWPVCCSSSGTWHEHYEMQKRQRAQWEKYQATRPKFQANWDRNAKREPAPPTKPKPKAKPKLRPLKKDPKQGSSHNIIENDIVFEDIEFKTPPLTPLYKPPPPPPAEAIQGKDDDFWDFYDQGLPLPWWDITQCFELQYIP